MLFRSPLAALCDRIAFAPAPATVKEAEGLVNSAIQAMDQEAVYQASPPSVVEPTGGAAVQAQRN